MRNFKLVLVLAAAAWVAPSIACADTFYWSYGGNAITASGLLTAEPTATAGQYHITDVSGVREGKVIASFLPCSQAICTDPTGYATVDNLLWYGAANSFASGHGQVDVGFIYSTSDGTFNVYHNDGTWGPSRGDYEYTLQGAIPGARIDQFTAVLVDNTSFAPTSQPLGTPEPRTAGLMLLSLGGLWLGTRRLSV